MPILVVTKLFFGNYMKCMPIYHIKKVPSKKLYFGHSVDIIRLKQGCMPIYGHTYIAHYSVIVGPIPDIFI